MLPAGVQFLEPTLVFPYGFGASVTQLGATTYYFGSKDNAPAAATIAADGTWVVKTIDNQKGLNAPAGHKTLWWQGIQPLAAAATDTGMVVLGVAYFSSGGSKDYGDIFAESFLWFSPDGKTWTRVDPRSAISETGSRVVLNNVMVVSGEFWAVGSLFRPGAKQTGHALALRSTDGRTWTVAADLTTMWASKATGVYEVGGKLALAGKEYSCFTGTNLDLGQGPQLRLWSADASAANWTPVDLAAASPELLAPNPVPATASGCPKASDYQTFLKTLMWKGAVIGAAGGTLLALSPGGTDAVVTSDLVHWTTIPLPHGAPSARGDAYAPAPWASVDAGSHLLTADADGLVLRSFEPRRDAGGFVLDSGFSMRWWRSKDGGVTWTEGPAGKPIGGGGAFIYLKEFSDGTVGVIQVPTSAAGPSATSGMWRSAAQPAVDWTKCTPGPKADCSSATISGNFAGVDWSGMKARGTTFVGNFAGIKLVGADLDSAILDGTFTGADFTGASLYGASSMLGDFSKANLTKAVLELTHLRAPFTGANFTNADAQASGLAGDLTGADFAGANFTSADLDPSYKQALHLEKAKLDYMRSAPTTAVRDLSGANFDGMYLAGLAFTGLNLTAASFAGADLTGAKFVNVNLTSAGFLSARLPLARLDGATFAADVTCPDGAPGDPSVTGAAGCRISG
jgi:uncharacterized protein YjbI with pentapeptide repeats